MTKRLTSILFALSAILFTSCAGSSTTTKASDSYHTFKKRGDYRKTIDVYKNDSIYAKASPQNTKIRVSLKDQRAQLLVGNSEEVALDTPVCTGRSSKAARPGVYPITEKIVNKRSTIFGKTYYRGRVVVTGDHRKYHGRRDRYAGASLPYCMRLTSDGIGMHGSGSVKRYPNSNGCIRTPHKVIPQIYHKVKKGTPIIVSR